MLKHLSYKAFFQLYTFNFFKSIKDIALFDEARIIIKNLICVAAQEIIGNIDFSKLCYEWRILPSVFNNSKKKRISVFGNK